MKQVTTFHKRGRTFIICHCNDSNANYFGYWAFEDCFVDSNGRLTKQFNGISGFHSKTIAETLQMVSDAIEVDYLVSCGVDRMEAAIEVVSKRRA